MRDRLLLLNSMMDMGFKSIALGGQTALQFLAAIGVELGQSAAELDTSLHPVCESILRVAKERDIELILPTDFVVVEKPVVEKPKDEGEGEGDNEEEKKPEEEANEGEGEKEEPPQMTIEAVG